MIKNEPMAGEMKKDGMMKEDVSKAARKWDAKMNESMEREKNEVVTLRQCIRSAGDSPALRMEACQAGSPALPSF